MSKTPSCLINFFKKEVVINRYFFLAFLFIFFSSLRAEAESYLLDILKETECTCVQGYEEDRIFINPENITLSEEGVILNLDGFKSVAIPLLQGSRNGVFLQQSFETILTSSKESKGPCPNCGHLTTSKGVCKNPDCFFCGVKVL